MTIDWSKAPEGATHVRLDDENTPWRKQENGNWFAWWDESSEWVVVDTPWLSHYQSIPSATWSGEGLPPVGTVCEYFWGGVRRNVEIIAHWRAPADFVAVYVPLENGAHSTECGRAISNAFRPLRTPEQIAAEEQADAVRAACAELDDELSAFNQNVDCSMAIKVTIEAMIKAGYRKVEGGDRQGEALQVAVRALKRLESEPGCGCSTPCQCSGPEWSRAEIEGRMGEAEEALRKIEQIQGGAA